MDRFAVIGLGRFGYRLAVSLAESGKEVIAIDTDKEKIDEIRDLVSLAVCLDSTDEKALRAQGIDKVDAAIVGIGSDFEAAALTTTLLKTRLNVPQVISRATTWTRGTILTAIGADDLVNPEKESAERWRNRLTAPTVLERIALAEGTSLAQMPAPESFCDKTLSQLNIPKKYKILVVAIRRKISEPDANGNAAEQEVVIGPPGPENKIIRGDILVIIGTDAAIENLASI